MHLLNGLVLVHALIVSMLLVASKLAEYVKLASNLDSSFQSIR